MGVNTNFVDIFKEPALDFVNVLYCVFVFCFIDYSSYLYYFPPYLLLVNFALLF